MSIAPSLLPKTFSMKKGSELVWSICEWLSRIERTRTWLSIDRACDSDPASSAVVPLTSRQVMRQSRLSPPEPPRTWISIYRKDCILATAPRERKGGRRDGCRGGPAWPPLHQPQNRVPIQKPVWKLLDCLRSHRRGEGARGVGEGE